MAGARDQRDLGAEDVPLVVVADLVLVPEAVASAGDLEVVVAVQPQLHRPVQPPRRHRGHAGEQRRLRLLAAEAAAHAPALHLHLVRVQAQRVRHQVLHLAGVLRRTAELQPVVLGRQRVGDLAFEVEVLLAAELERSRQLVRRAVDRRARIAAPHVHRRHHVLLRRMRLLRRQHERMRLAADDLLGDGGGAARLVACSGDHREHRLAEVAQLAVGQDGVILDQRAAFVVAGDLCRGEDIHHPRHRAQAPEVDAEQPAVGQRRQAERGMQGAGGLGNVVGVGRAAGDVQVRRLVRAAGAHARGRGRCCDGGHGVSQHLRRGHPAGGLLSG
jgi:hypothetical protein